MPNSRMGAKKKIAELKELAKHHKISAHEMERQLKCICRMYPDLDERH